MEYKVIQYIDKWTDRQTYLHDMPAREDLESSQMLEKIAGWHQER